MSHPPGRRQAAGFSLIELIVVLSILAILLGIAIPNVQDFLVNYRASAQANDLIADIAYARGEAQIQLEPSALGAFHELQEILSSARPGAGSSRRGHGCT